MNRLLTGVHCMSLCNFQQFNPHAKTNQPCDNCNHYNDLL